MSLKSKAYELFEHPKVSYCQCVRIRKGKYKGLVLHYGRTAFIPMSDGKMKFEFNYTLVENPKNIAPDQDLKKFLGDVLVDIIEHQLKSRQGLLSSPVAWGDVEPLTPDREDQE